MSLTGLGMLFIGIAFVILAIGVGRMLLRAAKTLQSSEEMLHRLPKQMDGVIQETNSLMRKGNDAFADVHAKTAELTPLFAVLGDFGHGTKNMASWIRFQADMLEKKADALDYVTSGVLLVKCEDGR